jgi:uncharacterized membrane protein YeaQ/YmgE (transglycosylase-associated protein family)
MNEGYARSGTAQVRFVCPNGRGLAPVGLGEQVLLASPGPPEGHSTRDARGEGVAVFTCSSTPEEHMNWIVTLVVGGVIGWLASLVMKTNKQMGIIANVLVGIVGSSLGFWLAGLMGIAAYGVIAQWAVAVAGAAVLIFLLKALGLFK